jgi:hypothetical protein
MFYLANTAMKLKCEAMQQDNMHSLLECHKHTAKPLLKSEGTQKKI